MNFFERQDKARALSLRLTLMFILAVILTVLSVHILVATVYDVFVNETQTSVEFDATTGEPLDPNSDSGSWGATFIRFLCDRNLFLCNLIVVGGLILGASLWRFSALSKGGPEGVVKSLGGAPLGRGGALARDRRLYNVVEEIAIASGTPIPQIYVLENERSINACAVGTSPENAAVCVTSGALDLLSRDELQGVVAHEFSHIVNRDMRLNMRLIGVLFGIELLSMIAVIAIRMLFSNTHVSTSSSDDNGKNSGGVAILVILLALCVLYLIGAIGVVFGNIIRAAISRQREYLADASAVQFTRNPNGIAGALKKLGSPDVGSAINASGAEQTSHMFFGSVFKSGFFQNLYKTHPPLVDRIKAIDPTFDGTFPETVVPVAIDEPCEATTSGFQSFAGASERSAVESASTSSVDAASLYGDWARVDESADANAASRQIRIAPRLLEPIPSELDDVLVDVTGARAVFFGGVYSHEPEVRSNQTELLNRLETTEVKERLEHVLKLVEPMSDAARLLVVRIATPLIKTMTVEQYQTFRRIVVDFCSADGRLDLFEYTLQNVALRELDVYYRLSKPIEARYSDFANIAESFRNVLACLAYEGGSSVDDAQNAFAAGCEVFNDNVETPRRENCTLAEFSRSLNQLAFTSPTLKQQILEACWKCVLWDGVVTERESALLSAVTAALGVPAPVWKEWAK